MRSYSSYWHSVRVVLMYHLWQRLFVLVLLKHPLCGFHYFILVHRLNFDLVWLIVVHWRKSLELPQLFEQIELIRLSVVIFYSAAKSSIILNDLSVDEKSQKRTVTFTYNIHLLALSSAFSMLLFMLYCMLWFESLENFPKVIPSNNYYFVRIFYLKIDLKKMNFEFIFNDIVIVII